MFSPSLILLTLAPAALDVGAFSPQTQHHVLPISRTRLSQHQSRLNARGDGFNLDDDDEDDRDFVYAGRGSGRRGREEGGYNDQASSGSSRRYQDNVEFFDLDDDDIFEGDGNRGGDVYEATYNGIIPNPLLDAMDPDGVYERLGPELFKDWTFFQGFGLVRCFLDVLYKGYASLWHV
mmetsp:Transcript_27301/g.58671  ORF Transcript_27301/g.58671 Transcript_27301/m.58671 type:complete len:178 (-) Transcript_27301:160-693(-)